MRSTPAAPASAGEGAGRVAAFGGVVAALAVGIALRVAPVLSADFPLTDGGLFLIMIEAVRAAHLALPATVHYNGMDLPFTYPPLGFYLAAGLAELTGASPIDLLRFIPLAVSLVALLAFAWAARRATTSRIAAAIAIWLFALAPGAYVPFLMGGGLTRGLGFLFAIVALDQAYAMYRTRSRAAVALCAVMSGLTLLSHPSVAWFLAFSAGAIFLAFGRNGAGLARSIAVGIGALAIASPWIGVAIWQNGPGAFLAAFQKGSFLLGTASSAATLESVVTTVFLLALLLGCLALATSGRRGLFALGWIGLILVLAPRELARASIIPMSLAAGELAAAGISWIRPWRTAAPGVGGWGRWRRWVGPALAASAFLALWPVTVVLLTDRDGFVALSPPERAAMAWASQSTPSSSRFLIITGRPWPRDRVSEWFPVLAGRVSAVTPQGTEWTSDGRFARLSDANALAQACAVNDATCLDRWREETGIGVDYVYLARDGSRRCCPALEGSLRADHRYRAVFNEPTAVVFARADAR